ncbi:MAG: GNAT family N-acetyltransferase [Coriobacteriales bacterium]
MKDLDVCYDILDQGRRFQQEQGFTQWTDEYPTKDLVREDIEKGIGYSVIVDGTTAGYMCITSDEEPAYKNIKGAWRQDRPYIVMHRWALGNDFHGIGLADKTLELVDELAVKRGIPYIRIDTDYPNKRMQHILEKNGYVRCGEVIFQGSGKIAYDKILDA